MKEIGENFQVFMRWLVAISRKPQIRDFLNVLKAGDDREGFSIIPVP
jgi:hypothetical protein